MRIETIKKLISLSFSCYAVEIMKPPPSTAMPTSTKGDNDFIDTQQQNNFDNIGNQTFMVSFYAN